MSKAVKQLTIFTLILFLTSFTFGCQAEEEIAEDNIVSIVERTGGRTDINNDGRVETILIEKDDKVPGIIKKLVILNDNGEPIFYLAIRDVPKKRGAKNNLAIYAGVKGLERKEEWINTRYYEERYDVPHHSRTEELSPKVKQKLEEEKAWTGSLSPSGRVDLEAFEKRVDRHWAKKTVLYRSGAISGGGNIYGYRVRAGINPSNKTFLSIEQTGSSGRGGYGRTYVWSSEEGLYKQSFASPREEPK